MVSLGASDAVMAFISVFYLTFPRTPVPIFRKVWLTHQALSKILGIKVLERLSKVGVPAIWLLPLYFTDDFIKIYAQFTQSRRHPGSKIEVCSSSCHSAAKGGGGGGGGGGGVGGGSNMTIQTMQPMQEGSCLGWCIILD